jgi:hypothetical protein
MKKLLFFAVVWVAVFGAANAFAQFNVISTPDAAYTSSTTVMAIPGANLSTATTLTDGTETLTYSNTVSVRTVPGGGWSTWNSPPAVESSTPKVHAITTGLTSFTITLSSPQRIFGFEFEPNNGTQPVTVTYFNGGTILGTISQTVAGVSGALLFAASSDGEPITSVTITIPASASGFAMAQFRYGNTISAIPTLSDYGMIGMALMPMFIGGLALRRRHGVRLQR